MTFDDDVPSSPESMGLRREATTRLNLLDATLLLALTISGAVWVWVSVRGLEPPLLAALASPAGRAMAALVGAATVAAIVRALVVSRWPVSEVDRSLV